MESVLFIIAAFIMGFLAAFPAGPIQIEVARRSINGHIRSAFMVILGAFIADILYGVIAFLGIAPFLDREMTMAVFWLVGSTLLIALSYVIVRHSLRAKKSDSGAQYLRKKRWGLIGGLTLSGSNPMMILWWLMGARLFIDIGLITDLTSNIVVVFLLAGGLGLASYLMLLSLFLHWAKRFIPPRLMEWTNLSFGIILFLIALYLLFTSLQIIIEGEVFHRFFSGYDFVKIKLPCFSAVVSYGEQKAYELFIRCLE